MTGGDLVADVLVRHGVRFLFTLCGGHISPILVSAKARGVRVIDTRHEATAVFAADAAARLCLLGRYMRTGKKKSWDFAWPVMSRKRLGIGSLSISMIED